jgi:hypothetical protein
MTPPAGGVIPPLGGDVQGNIQTNSLIRLKGFEVRSRQPPPGLPTYQEGDVLTFRSGAWVPESSGGGLPQPDPSLVPPEQPHPVIVAAGIVMEGRGRVPIYNGLNLRVVGAGLVTVGFTGYRAPDDTFQYIVKALPVFNAELKTGAVVVMFDSFLRSDDLGFRLRVMNNGVPMEAEPLKLLELMIEVSRYEMASKIEVK